MIEKTTLVAVNAILIERKHVAEYNMGYDSNISTAVIKELDYLITKINHLKQEIEY